ncbi:anoctamin-5-like isoform X2 [Lineus longissimus]|uniref:anoctamin-5-like isoform X2 n=1 Tax=Lineus longissimus TaxID=88925 RepID=UPI002B4CA6E8
MDYSENTFLQTVGNHREDGGVVGLEEDLVPDSEVVLESLIGNGLEAIEEKNIDAQHDAPEGRNLYFEADANDEKKRRIDYILAYTNKKDDSSDEDKESSKDGWCSRCFSYMKDSCQCGDSDHHESHKVSKQDMRDIFEKNLKDEGLELEYDVRPELDHHFVKIHAPFSLLDRYADIMKIRLPMKELPDSEVLKMKTCWDQLLLVGQAFTTPFQQDPEIMPPLARKFTCVYSRDKKYLFASSDSGELVLNNTTRSRIVDYILRRKRFSNDMNESYSFGIRKLLNDGVYSAAYPLHEGSWKPTSAKNNRQLLYQNWASWGMFYKVQPVDYIRNYFGEKVALYFAWLGFYTMMLVPASIVGLIVFIYGCASLMGNEVANDICSSSDIMMCPLCDRRCDYWNLSEACLHARVSHLCDNGGTFFFAIFMSIWGTIFLEFWKRNQAEIKFKWSLTNFEAEEQPARPEYLAGLVGSNCKKKKNYITGAYEPHLPFWRKRVPIFFMSFSIMIFLVLLAMVFVVGVVAYRVCILAVLYSTDNEIIYRNASLFTSATAACLNLIVIIGLNVVYRRLAIALTNMEQLRTQTEYDDSLTLKLYLLQFVNYYASLFYIAFYKGRFTGNPSHYQRVFAARQEECMPGGCLIELCLQLSIVMVGKQFFQALHEILFPKFMKWFRKWRSIEKKEHKVLKPWEEDLFLGDLGPRGIFYEYLEMLIQFGFLTIFVAAFPLAPLFALMNNIIEIRGDAQKFVKQLKRPVGIKQQDIGVWYDVLFAISRIAVVTNALIIGFTSDFIPRLVYIVQYSPTNTLEGYLNHSLSIFNTSDMEPGMAPINSQYNITQCRYKAYRHPPTADDGKKYGYTEQYWHILAARILFIAVFENFVVILTSIIAWLIPDVPHKLKLLIRRENYITNEIILRTELERFRGNILIDDKSKNYPLSDEEMRLIRRTTLMRSQSSPDPSNLQSETSV